MLETTLNPGLGCAVCLLLRNLPFRVLQIIAFFSSAPTFDNTISAVVSSRLEEKPWQTPNARKYSKDLPVLNQEAADTTNTLLDLRLCI